MTQHRPHTHSTISAAHAFGMVLIALACGCANDPATTGLSGERVAAVAQTAHETPTAAQAPSAGTRAAGLRERLRQLHESGSRALTEGRHETADAAFRLILQLDPGDPTAAFNLGRIAASRGRRDEAVQWLDRSLRSGIIGFDRVRSCFATLSGFGPFEILLERQDQYADALGARRLAALRKDEHLGPGYSYRVDRRHRLIVATNHDHDRLDDVVYRLGVFADALWQLMFDHRPAGYITVVLPRPADFRQLVPDPTIGGYYHPSGQLLLAQDTGYALFHEFTHALHFADLDARGVKQNIWFLEALATCFEDPDLRDGFAVPLPNHRRELARELGRRGALRPWSELFSLDATHWMIDARANYAQARSIAVWLHGQNRLAAFHRAYCRSAAQDPSGLTALQQTCGRPVAEQEIEWRAWLRALPPFREVRPDSDPDAGTSPDDRPPR